MKNKVILIVLMIIGVIVVVGAITRIRQPGMRRSEDTVTETGSEKYETLKSEILDILEDFNDEGLNATQLDDVLSIDLFELEPENENLGEIY